MSTRQTRAPTRSSLQCDGFREWYGLVCVYLFLQFTIVISAPCFSLCVQFFVDNVLTQKSSVFSLSVSHSQTPGVDWRHADQLGIAHRVLVLVLRLICISVPLHASCARPHCAARRSLAVRSDRRLCVSSPARSLLQRCCLDDFGKHSVHHTRDSDCAVAHARGCHGYGRFW